MNNFLLVTIVCTVVITIAALGLTFWKWDVFSRGATVGTIGATLLDVSPRSVAADRGTVPNVDRQPFPFQELDPFVLTTDRETVPNVDRQPFPFQELDPYVVTKIMEYLDGQDIANARGTMRVFNEDARDIKKPWSVSKHRLTSNSQEQLCSAISPDGSMVAVGDRSGQVRLHNAVNGTAERELYRSDSAVTAVRYSTDGNIVAIGDQRGYVCFCNVTNGSCERASERHFGEVNAFDFGVGGTVAVSCSTDSSVRIWNPSTGKLIQTIGYPRWLHLPGERRTLESIQDVAINTMGTRVAGVNLLGELNTWDIHNDDAQRTQPRSSTLHLNAGYASESALTSVAFHPDGRTVAVGKKSGDIVLTNADNTVYIRLVELPHEVLSVCFSPDGLMLASGDDQGVLRLWDIATERIVRKLAPRIEGRLIGAVRNVAIVNSSVNTRVLFCGFDGGFVVVRV